MRDGELEDLPTPLKNWGEHDTYRDVLCRCMESISVAMHKASGGMSP